VICVEQGLEKGTAAALDKKIFGYEPKAQDGEQYVTGMITGLAQDHAVAIVKATFWQPVGYPEHIPAAEAALSAFTKS
jgi:hypothetical protein